MDTLVIAEKPSVALRLAIALGENRQKRMSLNGVSYYQIDNPDGRIYIAPAVGHIFTLVQAKHERGYPVLDIKWAPSYESNPKSEFTKKYLDVLRELSKKVGSLRQRLRLRHRGHGHRDERHKVHIQARASRTRSA